MKNAIALQRLQPVQTGLSNDLKYWNSDQFRRKQEERIAEAQEFRKQRIVEADREKKFDKYLKHLKNYNTGSRSLNEFNGRLIGEAQERIGDIAVRLIDDKNMSVDEQIRLRSELNSLYQLPEKLAQVTKAMTARDKQISKLASEGKIKQNEKYQKYKKAFADGFSNFTGGIDETGNPFIAYKSEDGGVDLVEDYSSIVEGVSGFTFDPQFDFRSIATEFSEVIGVKTETSQNGFVTKKTKAPDSNSIIVAAKEFMYDRETGSLTSEGRSWMEEQGLELTRENLEKAEVAFQDLILSNYDTEESKTIDQSGITQRIRANAAANKNDSNKGPKIVDTIQASTDTYGGAASTTGPSAGPDQRDLMSIDTGNTNSIVVDGVNLSLIQDREGNTYRDVSVDEISYLNNGDMIVSMSYQSADQIVTEGTDTKTTNKNVRERGVVVVNKQDAFSIADALGMSAEELRKQAVRPELQNQYDAQQKDRFGLFSDPNEFNPEDPQGLFN